jgi:SAM-dependent methyltransferase
VASHILSIVREFSGGNSVLELCCGAGRLCLELARAGFEVTGIDLDDRMLAFAQQAALAEGEPVRDRLRFLQLDVCTFSLDGRFDFVIFEDDGFVYLLDTQAQSACLERIRAHLTDQGKLLLCFPTPQRELDADYAGSVLSGEDFTYDPQTQIKMARCAWTAVDPDGNRSVIREGFERRRLTYPCELELLLKASGLAVLARWGDLDRAPFTDPNRQDYHYLCSRA